MCLGTFIFGCSSIHKYNSNDSMEQTYRADASDILLLNPMEGAYLNKIFETTRKDFDFTNKKIGFFTGSSGNKKSNKDYYFDMYKKHLTNENYPCDNGTLYIFTDDQKEESGGYDAAIVYWSKFTIPIEKVIKRLRKQH